MKKDTLQIIFIALFAALFLTPGINKAHSQTLIFNPQSQPQGQEVPAQKEDIKKAAQETQKQAQEAIKQNKDTAEQVKKEVEKVIGEKQIIEKEAQLKEEAAEVAEKEAQLLQKEAQVNKDPAALKKAKELSKDAQQLQAEAKLAKEKLEIAEKKSQLAGKTLETQLEKIASLEKELEAMIAQNATPMSFAERALRASAAILVGLFLFIFLKILLRKFDQLITQKDAIREDEAVLRMKTLSKILRWLGNIIIVAIVLYMVLEYLGFSMAPLLAGAGIIGLAFGFGGQYLIRDLINGLFILIEGQYRVNDVVKINEYGGLVEDINLRITSLRDLEGRVIIVPNGEIKMVVNYTKEYAQALFDVGVAYKENVDEVMKVIKEVGQGMRKDPYFKKLILADLEMFGVDDFGNSQVTIRFRIKTLPIKQWEVSREFKRRLKNRFDELGIEIPFPHRTMYWGTGKDNAWVRQMFSQIELNQNSNSAQS